jgi:hypothetical protein
LTHGRPEICLAHHAAVFVDVARPHLEQVVEVARDHQAGLDLGDAPHGFVEAAQVVLGGAGEQNLDDDDVAGTDRVGIERGVVAADHAGLLEAADALGAGGLGQADPARQLDDRQAGVGLQLLRGSSGRCDPLRCSRRLTCPK